MSLIQTPNQQQFNFNNGMLANSLQRPDKMGEVYDYSGGYNLFTLILDRINEKKRIDAAYGKTSKWVIGLPVTSAQIASATQSGSNVIITFTDPTYPFFRERDNVINNVSSNVRAIVTVTAPGTVTIMPAIDGEVILASNYPTNSYLTEQWNTHAYSNTGMTPIFEVPAETFNYTEIIRDSCRINRNDIQNSWATFKGKPWLFSQETRMMQRVAKKLEMQAMYGQMGFRTTEQTGSNGGLQWAIQDSVRGGISIPYTSAPTQAQFVDFMNQIANRYNQRNVEMTALVGRNFLSTIQSFTQPYILNAGIRNTFGQDLVKGIDTYMWAQAGWRVNFVLLPCLDDDLDFAQTTTIPGLTGTLASNFCYVIDTTPFMDVSGTSGMPGMQRIYHGENEVLYKVIPGVMDGGIEAGSPLFSGSLAANSTNETSCEFYTDCGVDIMAFRCGMFYPAF
jgi:hypothetical protein